MHTQEQKNKDTEQYTSPIAKELTKGEREHEFIFDFLINFVINLLLSAGFTYWTNHSTREFKLPWRPQKERPAEIQKALGGWMRDHLPIMGVFKREETKNEVASNMAGVLTLTAAGHLIMVPSVWLGAMIKAPFVKWRNEMHYGKEAMEDPLLKARHATIEAEERPTFLGAVLGRLGTILATQATAYTLGSSVNIFRYLGEGVCKNVPGLKHLAKFKGIDYLTEECGDKLGGAVTDLAPSSMGKINAGLRKRYSWSLRQVESHPELSHLPYGERVFDIPAGSTPTANSKRIGGGFTEHYGKYLISDIMYSVVTAVSIGPAINFLKQYIPGMTYKPKVSEETKTILAANDIRMRIRPNKIADEVPFAANDTALPKSATSAIERLQQAREQSYLMQVPR